MNKAIALSTREMSSGFRFLEISSIVGCRFLEVVVKLVEVGVEADADPVSLWIPCLSNKCEIIDPVEVDAL